MAVRSMRIVPGSAEPQMNDYVRVTINGAVHLVEGRAPQRFDYALIVLIAGFDLPWSRPTVTVKGPHHEGEISPGMEVDVYDGTVFNVVDTGRA